MMRELISKTNVDASWQRSNTKGIRVKVMPKYEYKRLIGRTPTDGKVNGETMKMVNVVEVVDEEG